MSKSWIVMSQKIPPDTVMYSIGGGAGSRLVIFTICTSPTAPSATAFWTAPWAASNRRLNPIWSGTPAALTAATHRSTSARLSDTGFSKKIALPALAAATARSTCVSVLLQIATASTSDASTSSTLAIAGTPRSAATAAAPSAYTSYTECRSRPGTCRAMSSACILPMRPVPSTAMVGLSLM